MRRKKHYRGLQMMYSEWTLKYDEPEMSNFKAKMHRIRFRLGLRPRSRLGIELTALPRLLR